MSGRYRPGVFKLGFTLESDFSQALSLYVLGHSIPQQDFFASTYPGFWYLSSLVLPGGQVQRVAACGRSIHVDFFPQFCSFNPPKTRVNSAMSLVLSTPFPELLLLVLEGAVASAFFPPSFCP
jgi:hypothetical protein